MNITIVKDTILPVKHYGGTERVIWALGKELSAMGHQVTFLVHSGSSCPFARVVAINPNLSIGEQIPEDTDIVHFSDTVYEENLKQPYVVTINGNLSQGTTISPYSIFVSANHAKRYGSSSYVYNGLDWDEYGNVNLSLTRSHFHFLGKAAWKVKNVKGAIRITKNIPHAHLDVLGGYRLNLKMGLRFTLSPRIHFHGMVDNVEKQQLIQQSKGLIFPILWDEPFGLCLIESLYYGSPVFGTPKGALPELIPSEVGFLGDEQAIISHLQNLPNYSSKLCHEYAADQFNAKVMALAYLDKFERVLNGETLL
ncbi:glycosyltransferase [Segatella bryantii]|uniref:glycosyltransferase n=1 Tax=Segatella bryantii TaxID=77095 RepID=UPI00242BE735|nr:glycosyltransferase [Segatella bryantii]